MIVVSCCDNNNHDQGTLMSVSFRIAAIAAAGLLLCACASQPEIPFDRTQASNIKTIGLLTPSMPQKPTIWLASDIGQSFGLIGALVDAGIQAHRDDAFWHSIDGAAHPPRAAFLDAITKSLRAQGYQVRVVTVARPDGDFLKRYPASGNHVDAYLDIAFSGSGYGYVAAGMASSTPFRPFVYLTCRLVRASDGATLMRDTVLDNSINAQKNAVAVSANPAYEFTNFDMLNAHPKRAAAGMDDAFQKTANAIGDLLR